MSIIEKERQILVLFILPLLQLTVRWPASKYEKLWEITKKTQKYKKLGKISFKTNFEVTNS